MANVSNSLRLLGACLGLFLILSFKGCSAQSYRAAVVAYSPDHVPSDTPIPRMNRNLRHFIDTIARLKDQVDIIVFPEYGITSVLPKSLGSYKPHIKPYSVVIPFPMTNMSDHKILYNISSAARNNNVYVVVNLMELNKKGEDPPHLYSTDVVFDPEGNLIAKCRKKHLNNENFYDKGDDSQSCTFVAKFARINRDVKFALLFDTDLFYNLPDKTQDVILTSALPNGLPLSFGLSLQLGFTVRNQVNLLAAGYSNPSEGYGGSGIYNRNGMSTVLLKSDQAYIEEVPFDENTRDVVNARVTSRVRTDTLAKLTYQELPPLATSIPVLEHKLTDDGTSACNFKINKNSIEPYRWVALRNTLLILGQNKSVVICALVKPEERRNETKVVNDLTITATIKTDEINQVLPLSLGVTSGSVLEPVDFQYRESDKEGVTTVMMSLSDQTDLSVFGVLVTFSTAGMSLQVSYTVLLGSLLVLLWSKFAV